MCCEHCTGLYYSEHCECHTRRGGTVKSSCAQCNAACLVCLIIIFSVIAYFTYGSWQKYANAEESYCEYQEDLSYTETCTLPKGSKSGTSGYRANYAYSVEACDDTIYKTESCSGSSNSDTLYHDHQKSDICYVASCDWDDIVWTPSEGFQAWFWLSIYIVTGASILMIFILLGCCFCWIPYKKKHGDPNERNLHNVGDNIQMQPTQSIFHEGGSGFH